MDGGGVAVAWQRRLALALAMLAAGSRGSAETFVDRIGSSILGAPFVGALSQQIARSIPSPSASAGVFYRESDDPLVPASRVVSLAGQLYLERPDTLGRGRWNVSLAYQHVRIDIISGAFSKRVQTWIEVLGTLFFLLPMAVTILWLSWPVFLDAYRSNEVSTNAGGLTIWPARLMVPIGFLLLVLQGLSELIKRIAFLRGLIPDPSEKDEGPSAEEQLAEELRRQRGETA